MLSHFSVFGSGVFANMGNYLGFGDTKIVPDLLPEHLEAIVKGSKAYADDPETMQNIWASIKDVRIYSGCLTA